ncbi:MAG: hypothetical protein B7X81_03065 [Hydrogenophilales bacterium 17-61-76]|nr:MAG: hypothetical protein B7Y21_02305 [Hydrogenophilales bacterium 16-61-112]OZA48878.1 MAG: hypothetical protein B7X81_03065 [Hydrogenophilales bacterium 17-61-76]
MGLGDVPPHDNHRAYFWEKRLHWPMLVVSLRAIPAFYRGELAAEPHLIAAGHMLDWVVLLAFSTELILMVGGSTQRKRYLAHNWLSLPSLPPLLSRCCCRICRVGDLRDLINAQQSKLPDNVKTPD